MRLCLERILPRDRAVKFALPPIKSAGDVARAMGAVTATLADGLITPAEGQAIARVVTTFVQTIETSGSQRRPQMHEAGQTQQLPKPARSLAAFEPYNLKRRFCCRPPAGTEGPSYIKQA